MLINEVLMMKKQNKIYLAIGIVAIILIAAIVMFSAPKGEETIRVGSILSLTGAASAWGEAAQNGINIAVEDINKGGGVIGKQIEVIYEDDQSNPTQTVTSFNKLRDIDGINFFIGASWTNPWKQLTIARSMPNA